MRIIQECSDNIYKDYYMHAEEKVIWAFRLKYLNIICNILHFESNLPNTDYNF